MTIITYIYLIFLLPRQLFSALVEFQVILGTEEKCMAEGCEYMNFSYSEGKNLVRCVRDLVDRYYQITGIDDVTYDKHVWDILGVANSRLHDIGREDLMNPIDEYSRNYLIKNNISPFKLYTGKIYMESHVAFTFELYLNSCSNIANHVRPLCTEKDLEDEVCLEIMDEVCQFFYVDVASNDKLKYIDNLYNFHQVISNATIEELNDEIWLANQLA